MFQPAYRYSKNIVNSDHISEWKYKGLSDKSIKHPAVSNNSLCPAINHFDIILQVKPYENCLKQEKVTFIHRKVVNVYNIYEINLWLNIQVADFALESSLFGAVKLTKNADPDKYKYSS